MKRIFTILAISFIIASSAHAQVFMTESNYENPRDGVETQWGYMPEQWVTYDQANEFAPLGSGVGVLIALGGAYLLKREKKNK